MIVEVSETGACRLTEADVFDGFKVRLVVMAKPSAQLDCGTWDDDGAHIWVDVHWLRSSGPDIPEWRSKLGRMLDFAERKGWLDVRGRVRAHVVQD